MGRRAHALRAAFFGTWTAAIVLNIVQPAGEGWHALRVAVSIAWAVSLVALAVAIAHRRFRGRSNATS